MLRANAGEPAALESQHRDRRRHTRARAARRRADRLGGTAARRDAHRLGPRVRRDRVVRRADRRAGDEGLRPDRLREALRPPARRAGLGARDRAQHLRLADRSRARRALLRALHAGGGLGRPLDRDHRPRPHDVGRDQVHGPARLGGQPGHPAGRHLRQRRSDDRRRPQRRRPDVRADLLGGRAGRLGRRRHSCPRHRRVDARRGARGPDEPARRRDRPPVHEDRRERRARPVAPAALPEADSRADVLPARRAHPARGLPHDPRGGGAGDPRGGNRPLQAVLARGDRGGPALVQVADPRDDRSRALPLRDRLRRHLRRQGSSCRRGRGATF